MKNVLVIDDEENIVKLIDDGLSMFGFSVEAAYDGKEGLKKVEDKNFDLVITDINLPGCSGNDVVEHIRKSSRPDTIVFGISGEHWELNGHPFDAVFQKPFSLMGLMKKIKEFFPDSGAK